MSDNFDMRDVLLDATADVQEIIREVMDELTEPMIRAQLKETWMQAPDEVKEQFKRERPQEYAALMDAINLKGD